LYKIELRIHVVQRVQLDHDLYFDMYDDIQYKVLEQLHTHYKFYQKIIYDLETYAVDV